MVELQGEVAGLLGDPGRVRVSRRRAQVDPPTTELDEGQHLERPEPHGLDAEEVTGDDAVRLRPEELGPAVMAGAVEAAVAGPTASYLPRGSASPPRSGTLEQ